MFIDEVVVTFRAGKGGNGIISWRREKYIPNGGPFGGDGGRGGDIILRATTHETTLIHFRHTKVIRSEEGERGGTKAMHGRNGEDQIIEVPVGTIVTDAEDDSFIVDLSIPGQTFSLCEGGRGGFGNAHFCSSTRQAPNFAELGDSGEEKTVKLELKLVADVGIVGLPNAGKSTLIKALTNVKPKIADYPFTTIIPNLGVMEHKGRSLVLEDVPGLIPGASEGKGLGVEFLKHIERTHTLVHMLDISQGEEAALENYHAIRKELEAWSEELGAKDEIIILSKIDIVDMDMLDEMKKHIQKALPKKTIYALSAGAFIGTDAFKDVLLELIPEKPKMEVDDVPTVIPEVVKTYDLTRQNDPKRCTITRVDNTLIRVTGVRIEEIVRMTDIRYIDGVNRVYDVMEKLGIIRKIKLMVTTDMEMGRNNFFEGTDDIDLPEVEIAGKKFSLDNILFMKEGRTDR